MQKNKIKQSKIKKIPIGIQDFHDLITGGYYYTDKTKQLYGLVKDSKGYYYFSRPRRFGKSLMISIMKNLFLGKKELFNGLYINDHWKWNQENIHPIMHISFASYSDGEDDIKEYILETGKIFIPGIGERKISYYYKNKKISILTNIFENVYKETGKKIVILIDEYDKPVLVNLKKPKKAEEMRKFFAGFYGAIKDNDDKIRFFFLSGLTKVMKMSIFSVLNHLDDITFKGPFKDIIGYTQKELEENFGNEIEEIGKIYNMKKYEIIEKIKADYNGFNFGDKTKTLYNPWDVNNLISKKEFGFYWADTSIPSAIKEYVETSGTDIKSLIDNLRMGRLIVTGTDLKLLDLTNLNISVLFFNAGYLTIKEYDVMGDIFHLKFPNNETEQVMLRYFLNLSHSKVNLGIFMEISEQFINGVFSGNKEDIKESLENYLKEFLVDLPGEWLNKNPEGWLKSMIGLLVKMQTKKWWGEINGLKQRSDLFIPTSEDSISIIETKINENPQKAINQIKEKYEPLAKSKGYKNIMKIGINWNKTKKNNLFEIEIEN